MASNQHQKIIYLGDIAKKQMFQGYQNAIPILSNPSNFNGMDQASWPTQTETYRFGTFVSQETAETITEDTIINANISIDDIVNNVAQTAIREVATQIVNGALQAGATVNIVGINVDAGYSVETYYITTGYGPPLPKVAYRVWWAAYIVYDSNIDLTQIMLPEPSTTKSFVVIPLIVWVLIIVVGGIVAAYLGSIALTEIAKVLQGMTTTTNTTTTVNKITNPTNQPITVKTPNGDVTIPPGGEYQWTTTSTTTTPNLGGILAVGAVGIGVVAAGAFMYMLLKGSQKPKS